jgi:hypothetical protein
MTHLWEMETLWFTKPENETINATFAYKNWKEFRECKPYKLWKPYILSSWSWKTISSVETGIKPKPRDPKKHILDCSNMLRVHPSSYDKDTRNKDFEGKEVEMLQIVFLSPDRFTGVHRVEMGVSKDDEDDVREWLRNHMPKFWKI